MSVVFDTSNNSNPNASGTSIVIDITSAAVGAWCYVYLEVGSSTSNAITTPSGWTRLGTLHQPSGLLTEVGLYRRQKVAGDTTTTFNYAATFKAIAAWVSYLGLDPANPDDGVGSWLAHDSINATYVTPTVTNTNPDAWAVAFYNCRSTAAVRTFTPDAALVERQDVGCPTSAFFGVSIDDSNGPVATGAQSYTATASGSEANGGAALIFLNPEVTADPVPFALNAPGLNNSPSSVADPWSGDEAFVAPQWIILADQALETDLAQPIGVVLTQSDPGDPIPFAVNSLGLYQSPTSVVRPWPGDEATVLSQWIILADQALETDLAQPVTVVQGPLTVTLGQALETDLAQPDTLAQGPAWTVAVNQALEQDDPAQPISSIRGTPAADPTTVLYLIAPGLFGAPGSGPVPWAGDDTHDEIFAAGQNLETDLAQPVTPVIAAWTVAVLQAFETDLAQTNTGAKLGILGQPAEADLAQPVGSIRGVADPDPTSTLAFVAPGLFGSPGSVGTVWPGDVGQVIADHTVVAGQALETDLAQPVTVVQGPAHTVAVAQVAEIDLAQPMVAIHDHTVVTGQVLEIDLAQPITPINTHVVVMGQPVETDTCQPITVIHPLINILGQPAETDLSQPMVVSLVPSTTPVTLASDTGAPTLSTGLGGAALSTIAGAQCNDGSQSADMLSTTDRAAGGLTDV